MSLQPLHERHYLLNVNTTLLLLLLFLLLLTRPHTAPQLPGILRVNRVGDLQRWHNGESPDHFEVLNAGFRVAVSPKSHQPLQTGVIYFQGPKAAVKCLLEPGFDQTAEILGAAAAEERQTGEVFGKGVQVIRVAVDAGQPAAPHRLLGFVLSGEQRVCMDLSGQR